MVLRCFIVALLLLPPPSRLAAQGVAQQPAVSVNVLSNRVALGETGQLIIKVTNGDAQVPRSIDAPGLEVTYSGEQSSIKIINGVSSAETNYFYLFRGDTVGHFTIPAFEILVKGRSLMTPPVEITIFSNGGTEATSDATKPFFGKLELGRDEFYVNEIVPFTLNAYVRGRGAISDVTNAKLENASFVIKPFREVRTDGAEVGSVYYSSAVIPSTLFALKPGEHRLGPAEIGVRVLDSGSGFGLSSLFRSNTPREIVTNSVNITVKPLPDGAPASFTGGVGVFEITAKPSADAVGVGDPISMEFIVSGIGNLRTMSAPDFEIPQTGLWKSYEANKDLSNEGDSDGFNTGQVKFTRVIIPEAKVKEIPSFLLTYFDPSKAEYVTLRTDPVPITVTRERSEDASAAIQFPAGSSETGLPPAARRPSPVFNDVMHIRPGAPRWVASAGGSHPGPAFYAVQILFSLFFCVLIGFGIARWTGTWQARHRFRQANPSFAYLLKNLPRPGAPQHEFYGAVSRALQQWRREHPSASPEVIRAVEHVSARCAAALYSGTSVRETPVAVTEAAEFEAILRKLPRR